MAKFIILIIVTLNGQKGVIDIHGNIVIPFEHETIYRYAEGRFVASKYIQSADQVKLVYGAYDKSGSTVIPFIFDNLSIFSNGWCTGKLKGKSVIIDHLGNVMFEADYDLIEPFNDLGFARVTKERRQGFLNKAFSEVIPPTYAWSNSYNRHDLWHVKWSSNNREALIDTNQMVVFEAPEKHNIKVGGVLKDYVITYDDNNNFQSGLFRINGQIILPHVYEDLSVNLQGLYHISLDSENVPVYVFGKNNQLGESQLFKLSKNGTFQLQCSKTIIKYGNGIDCFVFGTEVDGVEILGLMDNECQSLIEPQYQEVYYLANENDVTYHTCLFRTLKDSQYGLIQGNGVEILKPQFPKFISIGNGLFNIDDQNKSMIFNESGDVIFVSDTIRIWHNIKSTLNAYKAKDSNGKYGIYNLEQNAWIIKPVYESMQLPDIIEHE